jgi:hypothetical protein
MREIHYVDGTIVVSDQLAESILMFARELARSDTSDVIEVHSMRDGEVISTKLLLGPASQIFEQPAPDDAPEFDDTVSVTEIEQRIALLGPSRPVLEEPPTRSPVAEDY